MLHTIACSLLLAAATWASPVAADDANVITFEVEADGTVPYVDTSAVEVLPALVDGPGRALLGLSTTGDATTTNDDGARTATSSTTAPKSKTTHTRLSSSASCTSTASSYSYSKSKNAHVSAVAYAVKKGCAGKFNKRWLKKVRKEFKERAGYAIAEAWAYAATQCSSKGNAQGCAYAKASAQGWAKAVFSANAYSYAKALNKCKHCEGKYQLAKAESYGFASEFKKVVVSVAAKAESQTCVSGTATAGNEVYAHCVQEVYATAFAQATAKAIINGQCGYYGSSSASADAIIKAKAVIDTWEYKNC